MAKQLNVNLSFNADTSKAKAQLEELQQSLLKITQSNVGQHLSQEMREGAKAAAELAAHLKQATNEKTGNLDFSKLSLSLKNAKTDLASYSSKLLQCGSSGQQAFKQLANAVSASEIPLRRTSTLLTQMGTVLKNTIRWQLSSSMLHGFIGAVQSAYGYVQDLNASLTSIGVVTGKSTEQMAAFAAQANKAAKALHTSTTNYTDASLIYFQQGLDEKAVKERTDITIKLANITGQSAEDISQQLTAVWNNFADGTQTLESFADVMTKLGAETASSSSEIATGMEKFAAVADTVGLGFNEAAAALTTITATTRQSADVVGTALKTLFARIQDLELGKALDDGTTLGKYSAALKTIGVDIKDASGEVKDMNEIIMEMGEKWSTLSKDVQIATAQTVAGTRQYTQLLALMDNFDFYKENLERAENAAGTLEKQADRWAQGWKAASADVKASAQAIYTELLNDNFFISLTEGFAKVLDRIQDFIDGIGGVRGVLLGLGSVITTLFGQQIAEGLRNAVYNLQMFISSSRDAVMAQKEIELNKMMRVYNDPGRNPGSEEQAMQQALSQRIQLQSEFNAKAGEMSDIERDFIQAQMDSLDIMENAVVKKGAAVDEATTKEEQYIELLRDEVVLRTESIDENGQMQFREVDQNIKDLEQLDEHIARLRDSREVFSELGNDVTKFTQKLSNGSVDITKLGKTLKNLKTTATGPVRVAAKEAASAWTDFRKALKTTGADSEETKKAFINLRKSIVNFENVTGESINTLTDNEAAFEGLTAAMGTTTQAEQELRSEQEKLNTQVTNILESIQNAKQAQMDWAMSITTAARAAMSYGMVLSSISGLIDSAFNPDTSGVEKLTSIITSLGMAIPMAVNAFNAFSKVVSGINAKMAEQAAIQQLVASGAVNAGAAELASILGVKNAKDLETFAKEANTVATYKNTLAKKLGVSADTAAAIIEEMLSGKTLKQAAAAVLSARANKQDAEAKVLAKIASDGLRASMIKLYASLGPVGIAILAIAAAVMVAVAVFKVFQNIHEANVKRNQEMAEAAIKEADALKEEASEVEKLITTYRKALKTFENTGTGKEELESAILAVAEALKIENAELMVQQGLYDQLNDKIEEAYANKVNEALEKNQIAQTKQANVFEDEMRKGLGHAIDSRYKVNTGKATHNNNFSKVYKENADDYDVFKIDYGGSGGGSPTYTWKIDTELNQEGLMKAYEEVQDYIHKMDVYAKENGITVDTDIVYKEMVDWLNKSSEAYEKLKELQDSGIDLTIQKESMGLIKKSDIDSLEKYNTLLSEVSQALMDSGLFDTADEAREAAEAYLTLNSATEKYAKTASQLKGLSEETGKTVEELTSWYNDLPEEERQYMFYLAPDMFASKELFQSGIKELKAEGEKEEIQVKIATYTKAQEDWKENLSADKKMEFYKSSGIDWGNETEGIIKYTDFLKMSYQEQQKYLNDLEQAERDRLQQNNDAIKQEKEKQLAIAKATKAEYEAREALSQEGVRTFISQEDVANYQEALKKIKELEGEIEQVDEDAAIELELSDERAREKAQEFADWLKDLFDKAKSIELNTDIDFGTFNSLEAMFSSAGFDINEFVTEYADGSHRLAVSTEEWKKALLDVRIEKSMDSIQTYVDRYQKASEEIEEAKTKMYWGDSNPNINPESWMNPTVVSDFADALGEIILQADDLQDLGYIMQQISSAGIDSNSTQFIESLSTGLERLATTATSIEDLDAISEFITDTTLSIDPALAENWGAAMSTAANAVAEGLGIDAQQLITYTQLMYDHLAANEDVIRSEGELQTLAMANAASAIEMQQGWDTLNKQLTTVEGTLTDFDMAWEDLVNTDLVAANEAIASLQPALKKIFKLDVSADRIKESFDDIKKAAEGDIPTLQKLQKTITRDYIQSLNKGARATEDFGKKLNKLSTMIDDLDLSDIEIGDAISDNFRQELNKMLVAGELTKEEATNILNGLGYDVDFSPLTYNLIDELSNCKDQIKQIVETDNPFEGLVDSAATSVTDIITVLSDLPNGVGDIFSGLDATVQQQMAQICADLVAQGVPLNEAANAAFDAVNAQLNVEQQEVSVGEEAGATTTSNWHMSGTMTAEGDDGTPHVTQLEADFEQSSEGQGEGAGTVTFPMIGEGGTSYNGGGAGATANATRPSGGGSKKSGGGGSKKKQDSKSHKQPREEKERYHVLNEQLEDLSSAYDKASKAKDRLFGANKLKAIDNEISAIDKLIAHNKEYLKAIDTYRQSDKNTLLNGGLTKEWVDSQGNLQTFTSTGSGIDLQFDANGNLTNYDDYIDALVRAYNQAVTDYNTAVGVEGVSETAVQEAEDAFKQAEMQYELAMEALNTYEESNNKFQEKLEEIRDSYREEQDKRFEAWQTQIELQEKMMSNDLRRMDYFRKYLERFAKDNFAPVTELLSYWNNNGSDSNWKLLQIGANDLLTAAQALNEATHGDPIIDEAGNLLTDYQYSEADWADAMEESIDKLYEQIDAIYELDDTMTQYYSETLSNAETQLEQYMTKMEDCTAVLKHFQTISELLGKEADYKWIGDILSAQKTTVQNELQSASREYKLAKAQYDEMLARYELDKDNVNEATRQRMEAELQAQYESMSSWHEKMLSKTEEYAELINAIYENAIKQIGKVFEDAATNGQGWDSMLESMDRVAAYQDLILTRTNQVYETNKLMNKLAQDIDHTDNVAAKTKLANFKREIQDMQNMNEMSKFDLDVANARYEVLKAQIALEEAQNAKSTVRLQRDSEGNYGYVYTADQDKVDSARQAFEDKQNDLYNLTLNKANENARALAELDQEMYAELERISLLYKDDKEKMEEETNRIIEEYAQRRSVLVKDYSTADYWQQQVSVTKTNEAYGNAYKKNLLDTDEWRASVSEMVTNIGTEYQNWADEMDTYVRPTVGTDLEDLTQNTQDLTTASEDYQTWFDNFADSNADRLKAIAAITNAYMLQRDTIAEVVEQLQNMATQQSAALYGSNVSGNVGYDPDRNYAEEMANWLKKGGSTTDIEYQQLKAAREAKIAGMGLSADYYGARGSNFDTMVQTYADNNLEGTIVDAVNNLAETIEDVTQFDTGGYTGQWGSSGKLAMLHQGELVLNATDTEKFLEALNVVRELSSVIDLRAAASGIITGFNSPMYDAKNQILQQEVTIHAEFPNATNHSEIEQAFDTLINRASQFANRTNHLL